MPEDKLDVKIVKKVKRRLIKIRFLPPLWRRLFGVLLVAAGLVSLLFPIIPSWLLILVGLSLLSRDAWLWLEIWYRKYLNWRKSNRKD